MVDRDSSSSLWRSKDMAVGNSALQESSVSHATIIHQCGRRRTKHETARVTTVTGSVTTQLRWLREHGTLRKLQLVAEEHVQSQKRHRTAMIAKVHGAHLAIAMVLSAVRESKNALSLLSDIPMVEERLVQLSPLRRLNVMLLLLLNLQQRLTAYSRLIRGYAVDQE